MTFSSAARLRSVVERSHTSMWPLLNRYTAGYTPSIVGVRHQYVLAEGDLFNRLMRRAIVFNGIVLGQLGIAARNTRSMGLDNENQRHCLSFRYFSHVRGVCSQLRLL